MSESEQINAMVKEIEAVVHRFRSEFNITYASAVGVLECVKFDLLTEGAEIDEE